MPPASSFVCAENGGPRKGGPKEAGLGKGRAAKEGGSPGQAPRKPASFRGGARNWQGDWPKTPGRLAAIGLIRLYQLSLSPLIGRSCRHLPTCSEYGYEAIARHGLIAGGWLTVWRVAKCNPLGTSGLDPVPETMRWRPVRRASHGGD
ncbi:MAG: membrane protein insertion efficiency factor YidD [Nitratireductor sp.]|nr:membrane protein insertion efficiency factor YidD [Nitratireductor sp.]